MRLCRGLRKAYAITDAKISFVSLVNKAANKKQFLITKSENGAANFATFGRILKADADSHFVTGIVYEPMVEDTQGNYMTEEEITREFGSDVALLVDGVTKLQLLQIPGDYEGKTPDRLELQAENLA